MKPKFTKYFLSTFGFFYALVCNLQAPLIRSLISIAINDLNQKYRLNIDTKKNLMISALTCLSLNPLWIESLSLLHSVSCAMAFILVQNLKCSSFKKYFYSYLLTLPFLFGWGSIHPLGVIINIILGHLLLLIWLPLAYLAFLFQPIMPIFDFTFFASVNLLTPFLDSVELMAKTHHIQSSTLWILFWMAALFSHVYNQIKKQNLWGVKI